MNKKLLLLLFISMVSKAWLAAQVDTIPDLIISEQRMDWSEEAYIELTNMEDTALDLSHFVLHPTFMGTDNFYFKPNTILEPGESYVLCNIWEEPEVGWVELQQMVDEFVYPDEGSSVPNDSIGIGYYLLRSWGGKYATELWYKSSDVDSVMIDCFNRPLNADGSPYKVSEPIAGVVEATVYNTLIRKSYVTQGNMGDWESSKGVDAEDSEWLLAALPTYNQVIPFKTVGNHGENYPIVASSTNPDLVIDLDNGTLTVPWGIYRGDSIIREIDLGEGMAWTLLEKAVFEDSVHNVIQTGDVLRLKSYGNTMQVKDLLITVAPPASNMNKAFPRRSVGPLNADDPASIQVIKGTRYYVTDNMPTIDTIGDVPFATRVDTLYKYIEWASNANAYIIWKDGVERVDLVNGDILEVTAEDASKKQYYIDVQDYAMSDNVNLSAITWPDITIEDILFDLNWITDTVPGFASNITNYTVKLRYGSKNVPVFKAYAVDLNSKISYKPAVSLKGGIEERTTVITVTSESDTLTKDYAITFEVEVRDEDKQKNYADPYFSEFHQRTYSGAEVLEIVNPGTEPLDMSQYLITHVMSNDALTSVTQNLIYEERYAMYVPGYRFTDDTTGYETNDYKKLVAFDSDVNPIVEPGDVFLIGVGEPSRIRDRSTYLQNPEDWEITFPIDEPNVWGLSFPVNTALFERNLKVSIYLWKIENDAIQAGTKAIGDLNDLTLIDVLGHSDGRNFTDIAGYTGNTGGGVSVIRKSSVWHGNDSYELSGGTTPENSEWIVRDPNLYDWDQKLSTLGNQVLDPVTGYISTVSSLVYLVDDGYQGSNLGITGIGSGETVQQFYDNLIIADTAMDLSVKSSTDGGIRVLADPVVQGDTLIVVSADGKNTTKYKLDLTPLDNNTNLVLGDGSTLTIADGKVSGFDQGATLESVLAGVKTASDLSILSVKDADGALVPLKALDNNGEYQPVLATSGIMFEVLAQNGDKAQYQLTPNSNVGDAFVLSSVYAINQDHLVIAGVLGGTAVPAFFANITAAEGATITILDKADFSRTMGNLSIDDVLKVVSSDGSKTVIYTLYFIDEANAAPSVSVAETDINAGPGVAVSVSAIAEDDGLPLDPGVLSYTWTVTSGSAADVTFASPNEATTNVSFTADGTYVLTVTVSDGELDAVATVNVTVTGTGIESSSAAFKMYPNPANETVTLEIANRGNDIPVVSIYSITGKLVYKEISENSIKVIDVSRLDKGLYFVKIENGTETITKKLSIVK